MIEIHEPTWIKWNDRFLNRWVKTGLCHWLIDSSHCIPTIVLTQLLRRPFPTAWLIDRGFPPIQTNARLSLSLYIYMILYRLYIPNRPLQLFLKGQYCPGEVTKTPVDWLVGWLIMLIMVDELGTYHSLLGHIVVYKGLEVV